MANKRIVDISVCMGSSCYPRGNRDILVGLQEYVKNNNLVEQVNLVGNLCEGKCKDGPNIKINGVLYHDIDLNSIIKLIEKLLAEVK